MSPGDAPESTPTGWYRDPADAGLSRYWDGANWTDETRPLAEMAVLRDQRDLAEHPDQQADWLERKRRLMADERAAAASADPSAGCSRCGADADEGGWCGVCGADLLPEANHPRFSRAADEREAMWVENPEAARETYRRRHAPPPARATSDSPANTNLPAVIARASTRPEARRGGLFGGGKSPEEKAAQKAERERQRYLRTPVGQAETAFNRGDKVFQYSHDVMSQQAVIVAMVGSTTTKSTADPSEILNAVCSKGWELVNGSFVFVVEGEQSRDKFMSSGQNVAVKGRTVGYYLFRRVA